MITQTRIGTNESGSGELIGLIVCLSLIALFGLYHGLKHLYYAYKLRKKNEHKKLV